MRIPSWLDQWAEQSRLNPYRLLRMPLPRPSEADRAAFDRLLDATPDGGEVAYDLPQPKWWFLHHAVGRGFVLHGTNESAVDELRTRATGDAYGAPVEGLFASDDPIWPLYFATVRRSALRGGYINWATHVRGEGRYLFSIGADPRDPASWSGGTIYLLPAASFRRTAETRELISAEPVRPRARLHVEPGDFPFRAQTLGHGAGDSVPRVVLRHALRPPALLVAALAGALVALAGLVAAGSLTGLDNYAIHHWMPWAVTPGPHRLVDPTAVFVPQTRSTLAGSLVGIWTFPGSPFVSLLVVAVCAAVLYRRGNRRAAVAVAALWLLANALEVLGKLTLERPGIDISNLRDSFPSGHTVRAFVVAAVVWWTWRRAGAAALVWALAVPFALVALGDHVPTDVLGGALLAGCLVAALRPTA